MTKIPGKITDLDLQYVVPCDGHDVIIKLMQTFGGEKTFASPPMCEETSITPQGVVTKGMLADAGAGLNEFREETLTLTEADVARGWAQLSWAATAGREAAAEIVKLDGAGPCAVGLDFNVSGDRLLFGGLALGPRVQAGDEITVRYPFGGGDELPVFSQLPLDDDSDISICAPAGLGVVAALREDGAWWSDDICTTWHAGQAPDGIGAGRIVWSPALGVLLAVQKGGRWLTSRDGKAWTAHALPEGTPEGALDNVIWSDVAGAFVSIWGEGASSGQGKFLSFVSRDGMSFTATEDPLTAQYGVKEDYLKWDDVLGGHPEGAYPYYDALLGDMSYVVLRDDTAGGRIIAVTGLSLDPQNEIYNNRGLTVTGSGLITSTDGGATWRVEICEWVAHNHYTVFNDADRKMYRRGTMLIGGATFSPSLGIFLAPGGEHGDIAISRDGIVWDIHAFSEPGFSVGGMSWYDGLDAFADLSRGTFTPDGIRWSRIEGLTIPSHDALTYAPDADAAIFVKLEKSKMEGLRHEFRILRNVRGYLP